MDRAIVVSTLLLVGLTWLLYRLTVLLEGAGKPAGRATKASAASAETAGADDRRLKPVNQRSRT